MRLYLTSSFKDTVNVFKNFEKPEVGKKVTFIPTASIVEEVNFYVAMGKEALESCGLIVEELEISTATIEEIATKLEANDYIYISGGNNFFLLQELKKKEAHKLIVEQVKNGKVYIGESAGSIIVTKNVEYSKAMDNPSKAPELTNYDALNLVDFYIVPHYGCMPFEAEAQAIVDEYSEKLELITIANEDVVIIENSEIKVVTSDDK